MIIRLLAILLLIQPQYGEAVKLINKQTGFVVVEFSNGKHHFHDKLLEAELKELGIIIPSAMTDQFGGKKVIFPNDPLFEKAFVEVYYRYSIANPSYQWIEN